MLFTGWGKKQLSLKTSFCLEILLRHTNLSFVCKKTLETIFFDWFQKEQKMD